MKMKEVRDARDKAVNELIKSVGIFFAFSDKQFEENKTPLEGGDKYVDIGAGGFIPKSRLSDYVEGMAKIEADFAKALEDKQVREDYIRYELWNHEASYTGSIESTLEALGDTFTRDEVLAVFTKKHVRGG